MYAPIVIFAFNRPNELHKLIASLQKNSLYANSDVYFFIDGCRNESDREKVNQVIKIAQRESSNLFISPQNKGLARNIIDGVSSVINRYGKAIILEDDLYCAPGFLNYMNNALNLYEPDSRIISVCGYGLKIKRPTDYVGDVYLSNRSSSWGWATWADRWNMIDWNVSDWDTIKRSHKIQKEFNRAGSDMFGMLKDYMEGRNNSWAIRFCYHQFCHNLYSVHPFKSLVDNNGFGIGATNCRQKYSRFKTEMNTANNQPLTLPNLLQANRVILNQLYRYHSLRIRLYSRLRKILNV